MQIVIEIPDRFVGMIGFTTPEIEVIVTAVLHGTPLPKGCGRLIDANKASDVARETKTDEDGRIIRNFLNTLPTIIKSDKESEDKK